MFKVSKIIYSHAPGEDPDRMDKAVRAGLKTALMYWRKTYLKKHFTRGGGIEYGYRDRVKYRSKYVDRRAAQPDSYQSPLVWTGTLRQMVLGQFPQPRISRNGATQIGSLVFRTPKYTDTSGRKHNYAFFSRTKQGHNIMQMYEEITTTSERETIAMEQIISQTVDMEMSRGRGVA